MYIVNEDNALRSLSLGGVRRDHYEEFQNHAEKNRREGATVIRNVYSVTIHVYHCEKISSFSDLYIMTHYNFLKLPFKYEIFN